MMERTRHELPNAASTLPSIAASSLSLQNATRRCDPSTEEYHWRGAQYEDGVRGPVSELVWRNNATRSTILSGAFRRVVLVVGRIRPHSHKLLQRAYQPYFQTVLFIARVPFPPNMINDTVQCKDGLSNYDASYFCVASLLASN